MTYPAPGRISGPATTIGTHPRADPRLVAALKALGMDSRAAVPPVDHTSPRERLLEFCAAAEAGIEQLFAAAQHGTSSITGVNSAVRTITGPDANEIALYVHRPADTPGPLPAVVHLHGGGMVILEAGSACYTRWRDELAATGLVVVGVEFRNGSGLQGAHPFPAGLDDCVAATQWVASHLEELSASHLILSGDSGGGNLTIATMLRAKRESWAHQIAGVYAQCPYIADPRALPAGCPSALEYDGYFLSRDMLAVMAEVYDPGSTNAHDVTCWPFNTSAADLVGFPPHVISVNELDPLRDEALAFYRRLIEADVPATARVVPGTCHAADIIFRGALPEVYAASIRDIARFARAVGCANNLGD